MRALQTEIESPQLVAEARKLGGGCLSRLVRHLRSQRKLKIEERIAWLTAKVEYWSTKTTPNGTLPERICDDISDWKGEIAALNVRLKSLPNDQSLPPADTTKNQK